MDPELKQFLESKFKEVSDNSTKNHETTRQELGAVRRTSWLLWRHAFGSDPPKPGPGEDPSHHLTLKPEDEELLKPHLERIKAKPGVEAIGQKISAHELDIAGLHGMVISMDAKMNDAMTELREQSKQMSIGRKGRDYLFSRQGLKDVATLIAGATGLLTALGTTYALVTGRLPLPITTPPPAAQIQPVPMPTPLPSGVVLPPPATSIR